MTITVHMPEAGRHRRAAYIDLGHARDDFRADVLAGLARAEKQLSAKYFYDARGSKLFDRITELPEYYPTRTELGILRDHADDIAELAGPQTTVVEFGAGSSIKIRLLLDAVDAQAFVPIDISGEHLREAADVLAIDYPGTDVLAVCADFTRPIELPDEVPAENRLGFFPGSTIGNFTPAEAEKFLRQCAALLGPGSGLVIGVDLKKDVQLLHDAYNDAAGVTAAFNLNLLARINRELHGTFDLRAFRHKAFYNEGEGRIEMHIESLCDQTVHVAGAQVPFRNGETIHTENSCKYTVTEFQALAAESGYEPVAVWTDQQKLFSLHYLRATA